MLDGLTFLSKLLIWGDKYSDFRGRRALERWELERVETGLHLSRGVALRFGERSSLIASDFSKGTILSLGGAGESKPLQLSPKPVRGFFRLADNKKTLVLTGNRLTTKT